MSTSTRDVRMTGMVWRHSRIRLGRQEAEQFMKPLDRSTLGPAGP